MAYIVLSDIHANLSALRAALRHARNSYSGFSIIILGDIINYGMRPNEVIAELRQLSEPIEFILSGNHEQALRDGDDTRFSTDRGRAVLACTKRMLADESRAFLNCDVLPSGSTEFVTSTGKKVLAIHGSLDDPFWGVIDSCSSRDERYAPYDYVLSGHSHIPHLIEEFHAADAPELRNRHRTVFLNPGSVGQPRNQNPRAQYMFWDPDTETVHFNSAAYDIAEEQSLYTDEADPFYRDRLLRGI